MHISAKMQPKILKLIHY